MHLKGKYKKYYHYVHKIKNVMDSISCRERRKKTLMHTRDCSIFVRYPLCISSNVNVFIC